MSAREIFAVFAILLLPVSPVAVVVAPWAGPTAVAQEPAEEAPEEELGVLVPASQVDAEDQPWTQRYLAPTVLAMAAVAIALAVVYYTVRVRGRYRIVK